MKEFFKDHPILASVVTVLSVWSITGTVRHIADRASSKDNTKGPDVGGVDKPLELQPVDSPKEIEGWGWDEEKK